MRSDLTEIIERLYLKGRVTAKYRADKNPGSISDSSFNILETEIVEIEQSNEIEFFQDRDNSLEFTLIQDVLIQLEDHELEGYRFNEDIQYSKIDEIELSNTLVEGHSTFGLLQGKIRFFLTRPRSIELVDYEIPIESIEIVFPKVKRQRLLNRFKSYLKDFFKLIGLLFLIVVLFYFLKKIDFSSKAERLSENVHQTQEFFNSRTIHLSKKADHSYATVKIGGTTKEYMIDTGASATTIPDSYLRELINKGIINPDLDFVRNQFFTIANGERLKGTIWRIRRMKVEGLDLYNVEVAVTPGDKGSFLLGMSTLKKFGNYVIVPEEAKIIIYKD
jgi:predicted aspartyl protease